MTTEREQLVARCKEKKKEEETETLDTKRILNYGTSFLLITTIQPIQTVERTHHFLCLLLLIELRMLSVFQFIKTYI